MIVGAQMRRTLIVPAAGLGSRLRTARPKALVPVNGRPMLDHLIERHRPFVERLIVIVHPSFAAEIAAWLDRHAAVLPSHIVEQPQPTGMLDAILLARSALDAAERVWITWCDQVGVLPGTAARLADADAVDVPPALVLPTVITQHPYIHFTRDAARRIVSVLQRREGDAMPEAGEGDMGLFSLSRHAYERDLREYASVASTGAATGERNFLPFIAWLASRADVATIPCTDPMEAVGINTPEELAAVEAWLRGRAATSPS
jgi:bifunctional UDP-N-acetylglucosamine pyrophosphorylase/glucosamine-1-phosphate N-acetyltransferase